MKMPLGFVSVLDSKNQYIQSELNLSLSQSALIEDCCQKVLEQRDIFICNDLQQQATFRHYDAVKQSPFIRFYVGYPLKTCDEKTIGTLSILDIQPRILSDEELHIFEKIAGLISDFLTTWHSVGYIDTVTRLPNRQQLLKDIDFSVEGSFKLVIIDCIDMPLAYEIARSLGMSAVETLLFNIAKELQIRLSLAGVLYSVAVGRFAFFINKQTELTLESISLNIQGIQARLNQDIALDLDIYIGDSGSCDNTQTSNEILRRAVSALHEAISQGLRFKTYDDVEDFRKKTDFSLLTEIRQALHENKGLYLVYQPKISLVYWTCNGR